MNYAIVLHNLKQTDPFHVRKNKKNQIFKNVVCVCFSSEQKE